MTASRILPDERYSYRQPPLQSGPFACQQVATSANGNTKPVGTAQYANIMLMVGAFLKHL